MVPEIIILTTYSVGSALKHTDNVLAVFFLEKNNNVVGSALDELEQSFHDWCLMLTRSQNESNSTNSMIVKCWGKMTPANLINLFLSWRSISQGRYRTRGFKRKQTPLYHDLAWLRSFREKKLEARIANSFGTECLRGLWMFIIVFVFWGSGISLL